MNTIGFDAFHQLDLRIGEVKSAKPVVGSRKLMALGVDLGDEYKVVTILAGTQGVFEETDLVGKKFMFVANLEPKEMAGETSNGMLLAADVDHKPYLLEMPQELANGTRVC